MRPEGVSRALAVAAVFPIALLYGALVYWLIQNPGLLPAGTVETIEFFSQIARTLIIFIVPRFRRASFYSTCMVFAPDLLIATGLVATSIASGASYLLSFSEQLIGAWVPSFLMAFLPLATYKTASRMRDRRTPLYETLPSIAIIFVLLAIFVSASHSSGQSAGGLLGVSKLLFATVFGLQTVSSTPSILAIAGTVLALSMVVYGVSQGAEAPVLRPLILSLTIVGLAATIGWGVVVSSVTQSDTLAFAVPALALLAAIWGITRAR